MAKLVFTIAISGCSSAGKSTLAFLLSEIFSDIEVDLNKNTTTLTTNGSTTPSMSQKVPIIHGDEFFMPKHLCPLVTFTSTPNDTEFCQASLRHDEIGQYFISWNGTRANDKFMTYTSVPGVVDTTITTDDTPKLEGRAPSNESFMTTFSVASTLHEGGKVKAFTISGPDTDCDEAVNFVGMFEALKNVSKVDSNTDGAILSLKKLDIVRNTSTGLAEIEVKSDTDDSDGGVPLSPVSSDHEHRGIELLAQTLGMEQHNDVGFSHQLQGDEQNTFTTISTQAAELDDLAPKFVHQGLDIVGLRSQYADLIAQMRRRVHHFLTQAALSAKAASTVQTWFAATPPPQTLISISPSGIASFGRKIAIIESFLLFSDPSTITPPDTNPNTTRALSIFRTLQQRLHSLSLSLDAKGGIDKELEMERESLEGNVRVINSCCKKAMMGGFDAKLFLATSRGVARGRRFGRGVYRDRGEGGGGRVPGQMWKTEGYFDGVAWGGYLGGNGWLVFDGGEKGRMEGGVRKGVHVRGEDWGVEETVSWAVECVLGEMGKLVSFEGVFSKGDEL